MARVAEQVVGRSAELDVLDRAIAGLASGEPSALVLAGEPGIGKTRLLAELAARGEGRGCIVLSGSASELELDLPFWLFVDALEEYVEGLDPRRLASFDEDVRAELGRVFPSLSELSDGAAPALQDERYRAHRAVRELLERLAATKPLLLTLDDVHWADPASVELLGALLRRPPGAAVLLALGARPRQLPERLAAALERADRAGSLMRLDLHGLKREDTGRLLGDGFDAPAVDSLHAETGGNPFYLEQLARSHRRPGRTTAGAPELSLGDVQVPPAVAAALTEELGLLSRPTRTVLEGAAVAGDPFEPELAAAGAGVDEQSAAQAIDELLVLDILHATEVPRRFRFRHPLVRRAVYESAPGGWRLGAHERCAAALAERRALAPARAHHLEHAARHGDPAAIAVMREAGQASAVRAPASAARWFGVALRLLPEDAPPEERVELLLARAQALGATGRMEESRADLLDSLTLVPDELVAVRIRLTVACAGAEHMLGHHREAHARLTTALEQLQDAEAPEAAALMIVLAFDGLFRNEFDSMREAAQRALDVARRLGDRPLTATAAAVLTLGCAFAGAITQADAARREAVSLVEALSDEELAQSISAGAHLATAELYLDRYEEAAAHAERARAVGRATGQHFPTLIPTLASVYVMRGSLAEGARAIDDSIEAARLASNPQDIGWGLHVRSSAALAAGEVDAAVRAAEEAVELTRGLIEGFITAYPGLALGAALLAAGQPARAAEVLLDRCGGEELPLIPGAWRAMAFEVLACSYLQLGRREDAARAAALAEAWAAAVPLPTAVCWARRAAAAVALDAGEPEAAAAHALAAAEAAERAGAVVEEALSRTLAGRALAAAGDVDGAAGELERAAATLDDCGALRYRDAAERELRKLGRRIHRRTRAGRVGAGVDSLTQRELQVALLVVDRKTNAEIAADLFLSLKTVESHMRNLFRKLDVSSRVEVARVVERDQGADQGGAPDVLTNRCRDALSMNSGPHHSCRSSTRCRPRLEWPHGRRTDTQSHANGPVCRPQVAGSQVESC